MAGRRRRWLIGLLMVPVLIVSAVVLALAIGLEVDLSRWREPLAARLTAALGRPVTLAGPVTARLSLTPSLEIRSLHVSDGQADWLRIGRARLVLAVMPWVHDRRWVVRELSGEDVAIDLKRGPGGQGNWAARAAPVSAEPAADAASPRALAFDLEQVSLKRLALSYVGPDAVRHSVALDELDGRPDGAGAYQARLKGTVEQRFPYEVMLRTGAMDEAAGVREPWPLRAELGFLDSTLRVDGALTRGKEGWRGAFELGIGTGDLAQVERLLGRPLPKAGATALAGRLEVSSAGFSLQRLVGSVGQTALSGELSVALDGSRPRVRGQLEVPTLDLRPFLDVDATGATPPRSLSQWYREIGKARLELAALRGIDADLKLRVGQWLNLPGEVRDATVQARLVDGRLSAPIHAVVAGVALDGDLLLDTTATVPTVDLTLGARDSPLGGLAQLAFGLRGINGALGGFSLRLAAQGERVGDLARSLEVRLVLARGGLTYGNDAPGDARPVAFGIDSMVMSLPAGQSLSMQASGSLLDQPVSASLRGAPLEDLMTRAAPFQVRASSRSIGVSLEGTIDDIGSARGAQLRFALNAADAADAAQWFDLRTPRGRAVPLAVAGRARWRTGQWSLEDASLRLGRSEVRAALTQRAGAAGAGRSLTTLAIEADAIDLAELETLLPASRAASSTGPVLDVPILPGRVDLADTDLSVRIGRLEGSALGWSDLRFDARMRQGRLLASPFSARVLGTPFEGAVAFEIADGQPQAELWLGAERADVGSMLDRLGLGNRLQAGVDRLVVHGLARGRTLSALLEQSTFTADLEGGRVLLRDRNTGASAQVKLDRGRLEALPGKVVTLGLKGALDDEALELTVSTGRLSEWLTPSTRLPFHLTAQAARSRLRMVGSLQRPLRDPTVEFAMDLEGPRLDALNALARVSLPPWGPYSLIGRLAISPGGYEVSNLRLRVGQSVLRGSGSLDTRRKPAALDVSLTAPSIQLDDFRLGDWRAFDGREATPAKSGESLEALRAKARDASGRAERLLSREVLARQDAMVLVRVDQVMSGADRLGNGWLIARVESGRADIGPVQVDVPGGRATAWLAYAPGAREVDVQARLQLENFDYGVLARRADPGSTMSGEFSLNVDLRAKAPSLADAMARGNGTIDFIARPRRLQAEVFDLWAANLLIALASRVDPSSASTINCGIGRFTLTEGLLTERQLLLDTTRVRVQGTGRANFGDESIELRLRPQPKRAQFFSLATPIEVTGRFDDFHIRLNPGDVLATAGRLATSLLWVPLQKLFGKDLPADGADVCAAPLVTP